MKEGEGTGQSTDSMARGRTQQCGGGQGAGAHGGGGQRGAWGQL